MLIAGHFLLPVPARTAKAGEAPPQTQNYQITQITQSLNPINPLSAAHAPHFAGGGLNGVEHAAAGEAHGPCAAGIAGVGSTPTSAGSAAR